MRRALRLLLPPLLLAAFTGFAAGGAAPRPWKQVHPHWHRAYVLSFRSPDLLTREPDERWGARDGRLMSGGILTDFPDWLAGHGEPIRAALKAGSPVLLSLHVHGGFGAGLVTYSPDLGSAEAVNYPWLARTLLAAGMGGAGVSVAVDTCNAQAAAAHQLRPDLIPEGVEAWSEFIRWRRSAPQRRALARSRAYELFMRDRVAGHLAAGARGRRDRVRSVPLEPLSREERAGLAARFYGPRGVILATPTLANLLRLGPEPRGTLTADLLRDRLSGRVVNNLLNRNKTEFHRFREYAFLEDAGARPRPEPGEAAGSGATAGQDVR